MAIAVRASGSATSDQGSASSYALTKPAGVATGDLMVAVLAFNGPGVTRTSSAPTGWTAVAENQGNGASTLRASCYYRVAQAGDTSWTFNLSGSAAFGVSVQTFSGVDGTTPIDAAGTSSNTTSTNTLTANAVTVATANAWHLIAAGSPGGGAISATSFTALNNAASVGDDACVLYNTTPKSTGSTGTVTVSTTASSNGVIAIPFAIRATQPATLAVTAGSYALTGVAANLPRGRVMPASAGSFTESGKAANLARSRVLTASAGPFVLGGVAATLSYDTTKHYLIAASAGSYAETGVAARLLHGFKVVASAGAYAESGVATSLVHGPSPTTLAYTIYSNGGSGQVDYANPVAFTTLTTWTSGTLATGSAYRFAVRASLGGREEKNVDAHIDLITNAAGADITFIPFPPAAVRATNLPATGTACNVRLDWSAPSMDRGHLPTGFHVYKGVGAVSYASPAATVPFTLGVQSYSATLAGLADGTAYRLAVRAYNARGEESNTTSVAITADATPPGSVDSLAAAATSTRGD